MKIKRYKHAKKVVNFYFRNFDFRLPHQVLIDGTFTCAALKNQTEIRDQLKKYLGGDVKFLTSNCALVETQSLGQKLAGAYVLLKTFAVVECRHKKPILASECFRQLVKQGNPHHYFVATQDPDLGRIIHRNPGVPLLYITGKSIVLEKPSVVSMRAANQITANRTLLTPHEQETLKHLKRASENPVQRPRKKKKGPKEPNPLSVKKKLKRPGYDGNAPKEAGRKRKRRKRVKVAQHVKEELMKKQTEGIS